VSESARRFLFGTEEAAADKIMLGAGRLVAPLRGTRLGPIAFDGHELWHGVDFLYRDPDWGTPTHIVDRIEHRQTVDGFRVRIEGHVSVEVALAFVICIEVSELHLRYEATAVASTDLVTNRTGLVLLHPLAACGRRLEVGHTDGRISTSTFPTLVAPWPPFTLVRAIRHEYANGAWATCRFEGGDFEVEDQRNNADASFKTYFRSNQMPRPYTLRAGAPLRQLVELHVDSSPSRPVHRSSAPVTLRVGASAGPLPAVGTMISATDAQTAPSVRSALKHLAPAMLHLVLDDPDAGIDVDGLRQLLDGAGGCGLHLSIGSVTPAAADAQLGRIARALLGGAIVPVAVAAFPSTPPVLQAARLAFPGSAVGGGTPHFFTQLNRIEDLGTPDFLCFSTASVVHGADDEDVMQGLQSLSAMVRTLRASHGQLPVHVGPSSIGARRSPLGTQPASDGTRRLALARRDPRTAALYGAAWALGYVAQFAQAGVQAITLFDLQGAAALVRGETTTPSYEILRRVGRAARRSEVSVSAPEAVAALALDGSHGSELLIANLGGDPVDLVLDGMATRQAWVMDADSLQAQSPTRGSSAWRSVSLRSALLRLQPYAIASV
jgi:hypothetical protein